MTALAQPSGPACLVVHLGNRLPRLLPMAAHVSSEPGQHHNIGRSIQADGEGVGGHHDAQQAVLSAEFLLNLMPQVRQQPGGVCGHPAAQPRGEFFPGFLVLERQLLEPCLAFRSPLSRLSIAEAADLPGISLRRTPPLG
ncbi:hypothetical protein [Streptomyces sp. WAC00263]|uniref:hypothetical protein n=1 Tax=Streptomyces sp. WAC00263 TaxID=1917422 RepID=UPI0015EF7A29|nr:hypothetical protein [Streptomyces sp. WAC00263]